MRFVEEIVIISAIFHIRYVLFSTSYFSSEKDRGVLKLLSHILKSLFHFVFKKTVKIVSSDKDKVILGIHFHLVL